MGPWIPFRAFSFVILAHGVCAAPQLPHTAEDATCDGSVVQVHAASRAQLRPALSHATSVWRIHGETAVLNIHPAALAKLQSLPGLNVTVTIPDLASLVTAQASQRRANWTVAQSRAVRGAHADPFFNEYREMEVIHEYMEALALEHPSLAQYVPSIGESYEGRPIPALMIGGEDGGDAIYLQAELHAREWITPSTALFIAVELLESEDVAIRELLRFLKFIIIPLANPDGYVHTWTEDGRCWRKSRSVDMATGCIGTDLNRNWDSGGDWGGPGASANPCAGTYRGAGPFSEIEVEHIRVFLDQFVGPEHKTGRHPAHLLGGIDIHSFGQIFLRSYAWVSTEIQPPPNDAEVEEIAKAMVIAAESSPDGAEYTEGGWHDDLYPSSGVFGDYLHHIILDESTGLSDGISITAELRDTGEYAFVLPDSEIVPTGSEQFRATIEFATRTLMRRRNRKQAE